MPEICWPEVDERSVLVQAWTAGIPGLEVRQERDRLSDTCLKSIPLLAKANNFLSIDRIYYSVFLSGINPI
jgi:hypothetical protein